MHSKTLNWISQRLVSDHRHNEALPAECVVQASSFPCAFCACSCYFMQCTVLLKGVAKNGSCLLSTMGSIQLSWKSVGVLPLT